MILISSLLIMGVLGVKKGLLDSDIETLSKIIREDSGNRDEIKHLLSTDSQEVDIKDQLKPFTWISLDTVRGG
jgi:hypothetical protein